MAVRRRHNPLSAPIGIIPPTAPERLFTKEALQRAWMALKRSGGGSGMDGTYIHQFEVNKKKELELLRQELMSGSYRPRPVRQILVPKQSNGLRSIALWALRDRVAQRVVYDIVAPGFESTFLPCSYGFRVGLSVHDAVRQLIEYRDRNLRWVVDGDIKDCFDAIKISRMISLVKEHVHDKLLVQYIQGWLDAQVFNSADGIPKAAGVSQGSVLSPLLANVYLHQVDLRLVGDLSNSNNLPKVRSSTHHINQEGIAYLRYVDDLMVCCRTKREAQEATERVRAVLADFELSLNERKSGIVHFDNGFSWLGYFFVRHRHYQLQKVFE